jgi:hypothetical protein
LEQRFRDSFGSAEIAVNLERDWADGSILRRNEDMRIRFLIARVGENNLKNTKNQRIPDKIREIVIVDQFFVCEIALIRIPFE